MLGVSLWLSNILIVVKITLTYIEELASVLVAVVDSNRASKDSDVNANTEVSWQHGQA